MGSGGKTTQVRPERLEGSSSGSSSSAGQWRLSSSERMADVMRWRCVSRYMEEMSRQNAGTAQSCTAFVYCCVEGQEW